MFPVHKGGGLRGVGMGYEHFVPNFLEVCNEHIQHGQARGFAFLFYEQQSPMADALDSEGGFNVLNEASGNDVTIFYLSNPRVTGELFPKFNRTFLKALNVTGQIRPPCVAFFRVEGESIEDVAIFQVDDELPRYMIIEQLRRHVLDMVRSWDAQGDLSALDPIPLAKFVSVLGRVAR